MSCFGFAQQTEYVDFKTLKADITLIPDSSKVVGELLYNFKILKDIDSLYLDAVDIIADKVKLSKLMVHTDVVNVEVDYSTTSSHIIIYESFKKGDVFELQFRYTAKPKKALYFLNRKEDWNIWTQGQGKYTSNWLPSFDDVNEKVEFDLSISFDEDYTVLANGKIDSVQQFNGYKTWHYNMQKPMSSYLVALAIGKYDNKAETSKSGIPLEMYYYPKDSLKVEPTYRFTKQMFDFLEEETGIAYPWQNYKQVPVHDFLYAGMENTSLTIFSDAFMVNDIGFNDKNYINVNAHELAHQWFGDLVTAASGEHHWLQEGFATYYALLAEREIFGDDYFYFKLFQNAQDLARQDQAGNGTSLLNPKSSSLTFYQRGAWVLYALRAYVGDTIFQNAVKAYLEKHQFSNVETKDFISVVERLSGKSLNKFVDTWITNKTFPFEAAARTVYQQSKYIQEYTQINCEDDSTTCADYLNSAISDDAKVKVIAQRPQLINQNTFQNSLKVRQAISTYLKYVPKSLQADYESLLNDKSYVTVENALYNLWISFPTERSKYLSKTRNIEGFNDKNVKLLWLILHLNTPEYKADGKDRVFNELLNYTNYYHNADLRMNAFRYLKLMNSCNDLCKSNLEQAKTHHNWRMAKFAKEMLTDLENPKK